MLSKISLQSFIHKHVTNKFFYFDSFHKLIMKALIFPEKPGNHEDHSHPHVHWKRGGHVLSSISETNPDFNCLGHSQHEGAACPAFQYCLFGRQGHHEGSGLYCHLLFGGHFTGKAVFDFHSFG